MSSQGSAAAGGGQGGGSGGGGHGAPEDPSIGELHTALASYLMVVCSGLAVILIGWRIYTKLITTVRQMVCLSNEKQSYFAIPNTRLSFLKRNVLYAPIFRKRHNREFQLSRAINVGTLPTRMELVFLVGYFITNVIVSVVGIPFTEQFGVAAKRFRDRTGYLSVINMVR